MTTYLKKKKKEKDTLVEFALFLKTPPDASAYHSLRGIQHLHFDQITSD